MPIDFEKQQLHDPNNADMQTLLSALQGNILKGHGRDHTVHIFVKFDNSDVVKLRQHLKNFAAKTVTSALQQHVESEQFKKFKIPGAIFGNLFLTAGGYRALGFTDGQLNEIFEDSFFRDGMIARSGEFNDPPPVKWEEGYQSGKIDAMILLGDDDKEFLLRQARLLINELDAFCEILVIEQGEALRDKVTNEGIEHFGYVDGRSQPIYLESDEKNEGKMDKWNPAEPLNIVLTKDRTVSGGEHWGSYFVFRKLEQNVLGFKTRELELADELGFKGEEKERAGAMVVGRFEDGTPLILTPTDGFIPKKENNFDYSIDDDRIDPNDPTKTIPGGLKCPYQAHIRKANPRGDSVRRLGASERDERNHRVTRRGIPFGKRDKHPNDAQSLADYPTRDVGLLFMCFQAGIENQFAFMQSSWVNEERFVRGLKPGEQTTGIDPVIGQNPAGTIPVPQLWRPHYGGETKPDNLDDAELKEFSFNNFVKMKGGEFFFAPSMAFLGSFAMPDTAAGPDNA